MPRIMKLFTKPTLATRNCISGPAMSEANPNPIIANPVANPGRLGKYFTSVDTGVI